MVRVRHKSRARGKHNDQGVILVGTSRYQLDENGQVDVTPEHAEAMLQGANWSKVGAAPAPKPAPPPKTVVTKPAAEEQEGDSVDTRTREELLEMAEQLGVKVDKRQSKLKIAQAIEYAQQRSEK